MRAVFYLNVLFQRLALHVAAALVVFLPSIARATERAIVPNWTSVKRIEVGPDRIFFAYKAREQSLPEDSPIIAKWLAKRVQNGWYCARKVRLTDGIGSVVFQHLPSGPNQFDIWCSGNCSTLKYAIATNSFNYIYHQGIANDVLVVAMAGPTLQVNIGFAFFLDEDNAPENIVVKSNPMPILPSGTVVTIVQWRTDLLSSFGGKACAG